MARMRSSLVAATATIAAFAAPTTASAASTDCEGLQDALDNSANSVVTLNEGAECHGRFFLPSRTITFEGGGSGATLDGDGEQQILRGDSVGTTTIRNLTFVDGVAFEDEGGAIHLEGDSPATIEGNKFFSNRADDGGAGGAVSLELDNQVLQRDTRGANEPVVLRGNTFGAPGKGNQADDDGGAVNIAAFARSITVEDNTFSDNVSHNNRGGGLNIDASQSVTLSHNTFTGNKAADDGGGASVDTCVAEVTSNVFTLNEIAAEDATLDGGGLYLSGNVCRDSSAAAVRGDAVATTQSDNRFRGNTISGEFTTGRGGGEMIQNLDVVSTGDRFVGNAINDTGTGFGGGLAYVGNSLTPLVARNLVATGNVVAPTQDVPERGFIAGTGRGGGVFVAGGNQGSEFWIEDATIEANTAGAGSGIAGEELRGAAGLARSQVVTSDVLRLGNSIVFGNTGASDDSEDDFDGEIDGFAESRDVRSTDTCVAGAPHADGDGTAPNSNICTDPKLKGPSGDENVDQTAASPTIEVGDNSLVDGDLDKDYAGDGRVLDGNGDGTARVDMGADEYKPATVEPEPTPAAEQPAQPAPQGAVQGQTQRSCVSRRVFSIRIRVPKGRKARSATVRVNNKKVRVVRGKRLRAPVRLRGLPKGRFTVRITVRLTNGKKVTGKRTYHTCIPRLPGDGPPRV